MSFVAHDTVAWHQNRPGSHIRTIGDTPDGNGWLAGSLTFIEQICEPGVGAPTHWHEFDEALQVVEGTAEIWIESPATTPNQFHNGGPGAIQYHRQVVGPGVSAFFPARLRHGFVNVGQNRLRIQGAFPARELATHFVGHEEQQVRADRRIAWEYAESPDDGGVSLRARRRGEERAETGGFTTESTEVKERSALRQE